MAIELKNQLGQELQVDLPVVELLQGPTIWQLADILIAYLVNPIKDTTIKSRSAAGEAGPLTYGQQAMWVLHQLLPDDISFNVAGAARLNGLLDISALRRAIEKIVERHSALRSTFSMADGRPVQIVHPHWEQEALISVIDAVGWDQESLDGFLQREAYRPFDLENGPLLRVILLARGAQEHLLLLALNHLITDFWSMTLLVQDIYEFYMAELAGREVVLPVIELQAADVALWQEEMLAGSEGADHRAYWHNQLAGELPRLDLPTDRPRPAALTFDGGTESRHFGPDLTEGIKALSAAQGATLATTLLAAFQTLLHRYTGQVDFLVGTVIAGRERPELQDLVGYYINSVAIRADFRSEQEQGRGDKQRAALPFVEVLGRTRQTMLEAIAHQEYPLPLLADELAAAGTISVDSSRPPLFETMFIMQRAQVMAGAGLSAFALGLPGARMELGELTIDSLPLGGLPAQFDLTLMMAEVDGGLTAALHYNTQLFNAETMQRLLTHLEQLLLDVTAVPQRPVNEVTLLTPDEREQLLHAWNETAAPFPQDKSLHQLVSEQAARTPQKTAVSFAGRQWSYAQLEEHADRLACRLQGMGVGSGSFVALYVERSLEMVAGLLAVLKAGGAYIPLDPDFPADRLLLMLEDAQPSVLLTQKALSGNLALPAGMAVCLIDEFWQEGADDAQAYLPAHFDGQSQAAAPDDLAYLIYTSGSTGKPKGVQVSHRAAVNFLWSMGREPGISAGDHMLAVTTLSFDIALLELLLPLISGAQVTIASRETAMDGYQLGQLIDQAGISIMQATPATWQLLREAGWSGKDDLTVLCGGEALQPDLARYLLDHCGILWNMYGPTETTVWSTICRIDKETDKITIGRPIANTQVYILDERMQPVPKGVVGNLYIGGEGLAQGYLHRPELTAQRFVPNPFDQGSKLYMTGDLARFLADGRIVFLGRDDFQVKIRGYRIELGDIETAVSRHPAVAQTVCLSRDQKPGIRQLVAYIVPKDQLVVPEASEMRGFLRAQLPDYMIPAHFVVLDALPLLPNGKINRRLLPEPEGKQQEVAAAYSPPRYELEEQVAELCAEVLDLDEISIHDSFFDLGGNSLLATRLIFQTREQFQVQIPLRQLFLQPTVAGLSQAIASAQHNGHSNGNGTGKGEGYGERLLQQSANGGVPHQGPLRGMTLAELQAEAVLDPAITTAGLPLAKINKPRHVLLTGATGFVGAFLVRDLLVDTNADVHCLVRGTDEDAALERIKRNMVTYGLWEDAFAARVRALPGDLDKLQFGLTDKQYQDLARRIDIIIHNGALVNFIYAYHDHKAPNVSGTQEVLRLASSERVKAVHFVSTLSVFHTGRHDDGQIFFEDDDLEEIGVPFGGYAQSKWVGEKMILTAAERGIPAAIYRPGLVSGDSRSGVWNTADMMSTMMMACTAVGAVPDLDINVDLVPVDYVSKALVTLALNNQPEGQIFNICNPHTMPYNEVLDLFKEAGLPMKAMPFDQWRELLMNMAQQLGGDNWNPYLPLLDEITVDQVFMPTFDCRRTLKGLEGSGVTCPEVGPELLQTYLDFFQLANC